MKSATKKGVGTVRCSCSSSKVKRAKAKRWKTMEKRNLWEGILA